MPRVVLHRFLAIDAALKATTSPQSHGPRTPHLPARRRSLALSSYLPSSASPEAKAYPSASILVADVSGFTKLNETFSVMEKGAGAEQVTTHLNRYFSALLNIIGAHGGDCVKFAGDALIVLFLPAKDWRQEGDGIGGGQEPAPLTASQSLSSLGVSSPHPLGHDDLSASMSRFTGEGGEGGAHAAAPSHFRFPHHPLDGLAHPRASTKGSHGSPEQAETSLRAVQCALQLQSDMGVYHGDLVEKDPAEAAAAAAAALAVPAGGAGHKRVRSEITRTVELRLHIAVGCGSVHGFHVGGFQDEYEFVLTGAAFGQLKEGLDLSQRGEVVVSRQVWDLIQGRCVGQACVKGGKAVKTGEVRVTAVSAPIPLSPLPAVDFTALSRHPFIPLALRSYVPRSVLDVLDAHAGEGGWLSEIRTTTVIFCNLSGLTLSKGDAGDPTLTHRTCAEMQRVIGRNQGYRRQFLVDDKGTTLIVVFGVPPFAHEDDAYRGVKCAIEMSHALRDMNVSHGMGITTGVVYSGSVGSDHRQEHAVVGDIVNAAARIAGKAEATPGSGCILLDGVTYEKTRRDFEMRMEGELKVKGKDVLIKVYTPLRVDRLASMENKKGATGEMLNRGTEMAAFMGSLVALRQDGQSKVIFIEGEAGIGKTHLIRNFYRVVSTNLHMLHTLYAKGDATESTSVLSMWTPVLEQMMALPAPQKGGSMVAKRTKAVNRFLKQVIPAGTPPDPRLPFLNVVLSEAITLPDNDLTKAIKEKPKAMVKQAENLVYYILANALAYERKQGKHTVLFAEDVHLMDQSSLEVLRKVAHSIKPLLLVCSARPPPNRGGGGVTAAAVAPPIPARPGTTVEEKQPGSGLNSPETSSLGEYRESRAGEEEAGAEADGEAQEPAHWKEDEAKANGSDATGGAGPRPAPLPTSSSTSSLPSSSSSSSLSASNSTLSPSNSFGGGDADVSTGWAAQYPLFLSLPNLSHIALSGLNQTTCTRLACQRLHANTLDPGLASLIFKRSRGNPLYAVEVASHLQEKGYLHTTKEGHCVVNPHMKDREGRQISIDGASMDLPTSLKGLVTRRLDSLERRDLLVCKLASAFGYEEFERDVLQELCRTEGLDEWQVASSVKALQAANILAVKPAAPDSATTDDPPPTRGVTLYFCHELVHSACYDLLVMSQKLKLHKRLAELELRRAARGTLPPGAFEQGTASGATTPDEGEGTATAAKASEGGGFAKRLAASLMRKRPDVAEEGKEGGAEGEAAGAGATPAVSGAELKRRASTLTYHYTMAVRAHRCVADSSAEMRAFIAEAKDFLAQRLIHFPEEEEGGAGVGGGGGRGSRSSSVSFTHEEAMAAVGAPPSVHSPSTTDPPTPLTSPPTRPPPAPLNARSSWSGKTRPAGAAAAAALPAAPGSTPLVHRTLSMVAAPSATGRSPPPLPAASPPGGGPPPCSTR